jgi:glutamine---fructose-6-phosphate transaminase (isomerizing)
MCGIVGIVGEKNVVDRIIGSLYRLEYRGYDSAGVATINDGKINIRKVAGKINVLDTEVANKPMSGTIGIGHTRWATHGLPNTQNAHPHQVGNLVVVHNGIIENHNELREKLSKGGQKFESDTDTEVIAALIHFHSTKGLGHLESVKAAFQELEGAFAVGVMFADNDNLMIGMKKGAPLAVGVGKSEMFLGSDALALSPFTDRLVYLDDDEIAVLYKTEYKILTKDGILVERPVKKIANDVNVVGKGDFEHFMLKEIYEQPNVVSKAFNHYYDKSKNKFNFEKLDINWNQIERIYIVACGTSFHAAMLAKYWFETFARIPVEIEIASEFRYRNIVFAKNSLAFFISQSGETADTLAALKFCKEHGVKTAALVNVIESSIANTADYAMPIMAGFEIGVASTKAFSAQALLLGMLCMQAAYDRKNIDEKVYNKEIFGLHELPTLISEVLELSDGIKTLAASVSEANSMIYIGRGTSYAIALEGALKLKELSYIHAEGIASGELKHGPIALVDEKLPIVVISPSDELFGKTSSNVYEVYSRSGNIIAFCDKDGAAEFKKLTTNIVVLPKAGAITRPILYAIATQLLAYHMAVVLGKNVDQPRNLAKSVTVE